MGIKELMALGKGKAVAIAGGATVAAVGIAVAVAMQGKGFRSISVEQMAGTVNVTGEKNNGLAYVGQQLYSGDNVSVEEASELTMCMDNDKYVYADANTRFSIQASTPKEDSLIKLYLEEGSELNELKSKLGAGDTYEVDTPNSTMSVRGTTFRVTVYKGADGNTYTLLEVIEGNVECALKTTGGVYTGEKVVFSAGQSALVRGNTDLSEFLVGEENEKVLELNYEVLPEEAVERLKTLLENTSGNIIIGDTELQKSEQEPVEEDVTSSGGNEENTEVEENTEEAVAETETETEEEDIVEEEAVAAPTVAPVHVHTPGAAIMTVAPGCVTPGENVQLCTGCGQVVNRTTIPATGAHSPTWVVYSYPGCTFSGGRQQICSACGTVLANETIPAKGHSYSGGSCTDCGASDPSASAPIAQGCAHNWQHIQGPTSGGSYWICNVCGERRN